MLICVQGSDHYMNNINNQDYVFLDKNLGLVVDGYEDGRCSEVGTRLFVQLFSKIKDYCNPKSFEKNVSETFERMLKLCDGYSKKQREDFIKSNFLFTILACFNEKTHYIVKSLGRGYIVSVNNSDAVSFLELDNCKDSIGYYASKYLNMSQNIKFSSHILQKSNFKSVGIATDGLKTLINSGNHIDQAILHDNCDLLGLKTDIERKNLINDFALIMMR